MHRRFPAFQLITKLQRLREPLVQVWVMAGISVLLVLIGHVRAWNPSSEGKNASRASASRLLLAGARVQWSDQFGSALNHATRPSMVLHAPARQSRKSTSAPPPVLDLRPAMQQAASQPWKALGRPLREQLSRAGVPAAPLRITLRWNGDSRGNASLLARHLPAPAPDSGGLVIGNGSRSGDGEIEWQPGQTSLTSSQAVITLIGQEGTTTPAQLNALAELLVHLEALSGRPLESAPPTGPRDPALVL